MKALAVTLILLTAAPAAAQEPAPSFPSGTEVVVLDVVAADKKGRPVADLRPEELSVAEDGRRCEILSLRLVHAGTPQPPATPAAAPAQAAAPALPAAPARASLVVLVFDRFSTTTAALARKGALDLLDRPFPPDTWFAIFKVGYQLHLLSAFTTNRVALGAAIDRATAGDSDQKLSPMAPRLPSGTRASTDTGPEPPTAPGGDPNVDPRIPSLREVASEVGYEEQQLLQRNNGLDTLYGLQAIARALSAVEGRKSLVFFGENANLPHAGAQGVYDATVSAANRANVAVNTVDVRGLTSRSVMALNPIDTVVEQFSVDGTGPGEGSTTPKMKAGGRGDSPGKPTRTFEREEQWLAGPLLDRVAQDTGGRAIANTNDLGDGLAAVADDLAQYCELVYAPAKAELDGSFRRVSVKVTRPGVRLRTRAGYYATPRKAPALAAYEVPLQVALSEAVPPARFPLRTGLLHFGAKGARRDCVVLVEVPLSQVELASDAAQGQWRGHLSLLARLVDGGGDTVARLSHDWTLTGPLGDIEDARRQSAVFRRALPLAPGRYRLEVAVQDRESGWTSVARKALEVPTAPDGLHLASVTAVKRADAAVDRTAADPLRVGELSLVPDLGAPFVPTPGSELPVFVALYPDRDVEPPRLELVFRRDGEVVARAEPKLPPPGDDGRIVWLGSVPWSKLPPGVYDVEATARQAGATAVERSRFEVGAGAVDSPAAAPAAAAPPVDPALAPVLEKAGRYVVEYAESFRNLVAEESYLQRTWGGPDERLRNTPTAPLRFAEFVEQRTRAELVFVRLAGSVPWGAFRDVFEANGVKVRDRDERLQRLFYHPSESSFEQARRIVVESALYNIGPQRTVNTPTLALVFLDPRNQGRFAWKTNGDRRRLAGFEGLEVSFAEVGRPTITTDLEGHPLPVKGRFWIDAGRGTVLRSEVRYSFEPQRATAVIEVDYRPEPRLGLWVPDEMRERYEDTAGTQRPVFRAPTRATARYVGYRQFQVTVDEPQARLPDDTAPPR